jgi:hypothetical protein
LIQINEPFIEKKQSQVISGKGALNRYSLLFLNSNGAGGFIT